MLEKLYKIHIEKATKVVKKSGEKNVYREYKSAQTDEINKYVREIKRHYFTTDQCRYFPDS